MKYVIEMHSDVMLYMPSFMKFGSGIEKFMWKVQRHTDGMGIT
jgi:hypothetical protein